ncbi:hypothetical protein ACI68E_001861 [Malassezia pachydermatis]
MYQRCTLLFTATEWVDEPSSEVVELQRTEQTLWEAHDASARVPSTLPFTMELTEDLPQCIHTQHGHLEYRITAHLHTSSGPALTTHALIHPRRFLDSQTNMRMYTNTGPGSNTMMWPGDAEYSFEPSYWAVDTPVRAYFRLDRSVVRQTDPIPLHVHIPPPADTLVLEKGWKLQSVMMILTRVIQSHPTGQLYSDFELLQQLASEAPLSHETRGTSHETLHQLPPRIYSSYIAVTGKSCRFHSHRPVHMTLVLHPASVLGGTSAGSEGLAAAAPQYAKGGAWVCESISQDTTLHNIRFVLTARVVIRNEMGKHKDIVTRRIIKILPSAIGNNPMPAPSEKYVSGKAAVHSDDEYAMFFQAQEEYDGYDDASEAPQPSGANAFWTGHITPPMAMEASDITMNTETALPDYAPTDSLPPTADGDTLPGFEEAAAQPQPTISLSLREWDAPTTYEAMTAEGPPCLPTTMHEPPSYSAAAPSSQPPPPPPDSMPPSLEEALPPSYAAHDTRENSPHLHDDTLFPPLYEA